MWSVVHGVLALHKRWWWSGGDSITIHSLPPQPVNTLTKQMVVDKLVDRMVDKVVDMVVDKVVDIGIC